MSTARIDMSACYQNAGQGTTTERALGKKMGRICNKIEYLRHLNANISVPEAGRNQASQQHDAAFPPAPTFHQEPWQTYGL